MPQILKDIFYIDSRDVIQFPYFVDSRDVYCKFSECEEEVMAEQMVAKQDMPNSVLVMMGSFSANLLLLKDQDFSEEQNGGAFNATTMPNLARLNELCSTNIGVNFPGVPTILGWFGIETGNFPIRHGIGITQQRGKDHLTLAKFFNYLGYTTVYTSSAPPEFDAKHNILYNGDFENVQYCCPTKAPGFENFTNSDWDADRITKDQFELQIQNISTHFFANWFTIDTHSSQQVFDQPQYYDETISPKYVKMTNYFDKQLGKLVAFLKGNHSNAIIVVMGDHDQRYAISPSMCSGWDTECANKAVSEDYFGTTTTEAYIGEDSALQQQFNLNKSTINFLTRIPSFWPFSGNLHATQRCRW
ncbi:Sulfatase family protein [Spironucleus salmonicida]|uniref:Sulfatase n=1 Tax=Spironucleus salmonicida TaxID=348837 RepID=V6LG15_9EUKA|nr:Sulfatase family protein [Spironucleus salmonicida]|eukprot:EST42641.1 Sulfatase [Spironucleus salmonicida]